MKTMRSLVCWLGVFLTASAMSVAQAASGLPSGWTDDFAVSCPFWLVGRAAT